MNLRSHRHTMFSVKVKKYVLLFVVVCGAEDYGSVWLIPAYYCNIQLILIFHESRPKLS